MARHGDPRRLTILAKELLQQGNTQGFTAVPATSTREFPPQQPRVTASISAMSQQARLEKLGKMFKASKKLSIQDACNVLKMARDELLNFLFDLTDKFGFKIDGDYIVLEDAQALENLDGFTADIDAQFAAWDDSEKSKNGKI